MNKHIRVITEEQDLQLFQVEMLSVNTELQQQLRKLYSAKQCVNFGTAQTRPRFKSHSAQSGI